VGRGPERAPYAEPRHLKVLVDTSVWADFFNGAPTAERMALSSLLDSDHEICTCGVVVAEVFQGLRRDAGRPRLEEIFRDLTFLEAVGIDLHLHAAQLYRALRGRGKTIRSTIDCLIAVLAEANGCALLARDRDMKTILDSSLLRVERWPVANLA
jgi:predicted nucleic acid-binding protein